MSGHRQGIWVSRRDSARFPGLIEPTPERNQGSKRPRDFSAGLSRQSKISGADRTLDGIPLISTNLQFPVIEKFLDIAQKLVEDEIELVQIFTLEMFCWTSVSTWSRICVYHVCYILDAYLSCVTLRWWNKWISHNFLHHTNILTSYWQWVRTMVLTDTKYFCIREFSGQRICKYGRICKYRRLELWTSVDFDIRRTGHCFLRGCP